MLRLFLILVGGGIGSVFRYVLSGMTYKYFNGIFPWGTLSVNLIGSFLVGLLWEFFDHYTFSFNLKMFVFVGLIGGFTTFSTYALESVNLMKEGEIVYGLFNMIMSNVLGVSLVIIGSLVSRYVLSLGGVK